MGRAVIKKILKKVLTIGCHLYIIIKSVDETKTNDTM